MKKLVGESKNSLGRTYEIIYVATAVVVPPPSKATEDEVMSEAGIAGWLIAVIAVACVLFILLLLFREGRENSN